MKKRIIHRILGIVLILTGIFIILNSGVRITGAIVGALISSTLLVYILSLGLIVGGIGLFMAVKEGNLEKKLKEEPAKSEKLEDIKRSEKKKNDFLFYKDNQGKIRINDYSGEFNQEGISTNQNATAGETLNKLKENCVNEKDKKMAQEIILPDYILAAIKQRNEDENWPLKEDSIAYFIEDFLKEWDPNYNEHKIRHPLLREDEKGYSNQLGHSNTYDTREVMNVLQKTIRDITDIKITNHDISFNYKGSKTNLMGGSKQSYETSSNAIKEVLKTIAQFDADRDKKNNKYKKGQKNLALDENERYNFLKKIVFGN